MLILNGKEVSKVVDLDLDAFSQKYSFAIDGLKMRINDSEKKKMLNQKLYNDFLSNNINMNELGRSLELFYQGSVFGQVQFNKYVEKYK